MPVIALCNQLVVPFFAPSAFSLAIGLHSSTIDSLLNTVQHRRRYTAAKEHGAAVHGMLRELRGWAVGCGNAQLNSGLAQLRT